MAYEVTTHVKRRKKHFSGFMKILIVVMAVICFLLGVTITTGFLFPCFLLAGLYYWYTMNIDREYEYTASGDILQIDVIKGGVRRSCEHQIPFVDIEVIAPHAHSSVARYRIKGGSERLKKYDYTSYDDSVPYFTVIARKDGRKIKILMDLDDAMLRVLKTRMPDRVYTS